MNKYLITRTHTETYTAEIYADSESEARKLAENQIIDPDDYDLEDAGCYEYEIEILDRDDDDM